MQVTWVENSPLGDGSTRTVVVPVEQVQEGLGQVGVGNRPGNLP